MQPQDRSPWWQKALPLLALAPAAAVPNGTLFSIPIVLATLWLVKDSRQPTLALWPTDRTRWLIIGVGAGIVVWALFQFLLDPMLESWFGKIELGNYTQVEGNLSNYLVLLALGFVFGGIIEEVVFRSFIIGWGSHLFGERATIPLLLLSTVVFGVAHWHYQGISGGLDTGLSGLAFGILYIAAGRKLLPAMLAHATVDAIGITMLYLGYTA